MLESNLDQNSINSQLQHREKIRRWSLDDQL